MAKTPWEMAEVGKEFSHQSALFAWAAMARSFGVYAAAQPDSYTKKGFAQAIGHPHHDKLPDLKWLHAIKNQGHGDVIRGNRSRAEGVRSGVFDVFLPIPRIAWRDYPADLTHTNGVICGLYLELKKPKDGKPSDAQLDFQADMRQAGYAAEIVYGWEAARDIILSYLGKG